MKFFPKKFLVLLVSLFLLLINSSTAFGIDTIADGYQVTGTEKTINAYTYCYYVKTTNGGSYFFPTKTSSEFLAFVNNKPATVNIDSCQWLTGGVHTVRDCTNAGGTVYSGYCKFNNNNGLCPSGWNKSGYYDIYYELTMCPSQLPPNNISCDYGYLSAYTPFCFVGGGTPYIFTNGNYKPVCLYGDPPFYYGSYTVTEYVCENVYTCSYEYTCSPYYPFSCGYGNVCGYKNVCGFKNVNKWGNICMGGSTLHECNPSFSSYTSTYCY